jgi:hypothetical protein
VLFLIGFSVGLIAPIEQLVRQERTPPELRARVFATVMATLTAVVPLGVLMAGVAVEIVGLGAALAAFAVANALLALVAVAMPAARRLGDSAPPIRTKEDVG